MSIDQTLNEDAGILNQSDIASESLKQEGNDENLGPADLMLNNKTSYNNSYLDTKENGICCNNKSLSLECACNTNSDAL